MPNSQSSIPRSRIEGLTDLIFGLALSISAIELVGSVPSSHVRFLTTVAQFAFSFLILINIWYRYTSVVSVVPIETSLMRRLNMTLLFFVALEPYLFNLLVLQGPTYTGFGQDVSTGFALDVGAMTLIIAYFAHLSTQEERGLVPKGALGEFRSRRNLLAFAGIIFVVSAVPQFWTIIFEGQPVRIWLWVVTFPVGWARRLSGRRNIAEKG
ncbi:MAG TPA: TMEM175 family protein [Nitrososphaerales archaeon]|nr:TMEM175 family protein [Nitrososphaerales archaeon]